MKHRFLTVVIGLSLAGVCGPAFAQTGPTLSFIQPLSPQAVQVVQDKLRQAGAYNGAVDGMWGPDSATALQSYQQNRQLQMTGQLNQATAATLGLDPRMLLDPSQQAAIGTQPSPSGSTLSGASVRAIQNRLRALNFYNGPSDGVWGANTQAAIQRFQQGRGLQPNGQLNPATVSAMGLAPDMLIYR